MSNKCLVVGLITVSITVVLTCIVVSFFDETYKGVATVNPAQKNRNILHAAGVNESCKSFVFDQPNWTLYLRNAKEDDKLCERKLNSFLKSSQTKLIIDADGNKEYTGCTKHTKKCKEFPYFDTSLGTRVNTPPCCLNHMKEVFKNVVKGFEAKNISHIMVFGGVLGWMRNGKMVPYDNDLDLIIEKRFWNSTEMQSAITRLNKKHKHEFSFRDKGVKLTVGFSKKNNGNSIDIWPYHVEKYRSTSMIIIPHNRWKPISVDDMFPVKQISFEGIKTYIPNKPETFVRIVYGNGWKQELDCKHVDKYGKCYFITNR